MSLHAVNPELPAPSIGAGSPWGKKCLAKAEGLQ